MSNYLYNRKRATKKNQVWLKEAFKEARRARWPVDKAKRFATFSLERVQQGGYKRIESYTDRPSVHGSVYTYDRLVLGKKGPAGPEKPIEEALARMKPEKREEFLKAVATVQALVRGVNEGVLRRELIRYGQTSHWRGIERGKDLFIPGLGGFDIEAGYRLAAEAMYRGVVVPTPDMIRVWGYVHKAGPAFRDGLQNTYHILMMLFQRHERWTVQHWNWIVANPQRLDELPRYHEPFDETRTPQQLCRERPRTRYEFHNKPPRDYKTDMLPVETELGVLRPIASTKELREVAKKLKNCAAGYDWQIEKNQNEMVALFNQEGKPLALAHFQNGGRRATKSAKWQNVNWNVIQLRGPCNKEVTKKVEKLFFDYAAGTSGRRAISLEESKGG